MRRQHRHLEPGRDLVASARSEHPAGHVLDHADHGLTGLAGDQPAALGDLGRGGLRRRHDQHLGLGQQLSERDRDVARARRQVEQQHVEVAEVDVGQELLHRAVQQRSAPGDGGRPSTNMPIEIDLHPVRDRRQDHVADLGRLGVCDAEDAGDREPEHVGVDEPDPQSARGEGDREVRR